MPADQRCLILLHKKYCDISQGSEGLGLRLGWLAPDAVLQTGCPGQCLLLAMTDDPYLYKDRSQLKLRREDITGDQVFQHQRQVINNKVYHAEVLEDLSYRDNIRVLGLLEDLQLYICLFLGEYIDCDYLRRALFIDCNRDRACKIIGKKIF
ncbi:hypothetical protein ASPVEDRAFT_29649 [Aspergillus versicolor CBS 583.65]|uniref:Uncharacterized protein n=1 Tax=Aspergillus versicolor CBS 583.65 TaxID=1036611 RepID=A0A1L9PNL8_ASPVE|nr:uncharacterized protein ASPVEDRAFT_29649 [Aspergillus versicolor CBS 583.65]OJJ03118.1 hypothetical protein ASPVEDRAFT_29649 [Aspergillus versicolor CBS 583.65]